MNKKLLTSDVFSIKFLQRHPLTKSIIERYCDIGNPCSHLYAKDLPYSNTKIALITELDTIPVKEFFVRDFLDDFKMAIEHQYINHEEFWRVLDDYIRGRSYAKMINLEEQHFTDLLIWLWFDFPNASLDLVSPTKWQDAMIYLRYKNRRLFNLGEGKESTGKRALLGYQAVYIFEKIGKDGIEAFLNGFFNIDKFFEHSGKFFDLLNEAMGEDITKKFVQQDKPRIIGLEELGGFLDDISGNSEKYTFSRLYRYPEWIEFTPEANSKIISLILEDKLSDKSIDYFLGTSESEDDYVELYPAVKRIIQTTRDTHTLYTAGGVLNIIRRIILEDDVKLQEWFKKEIYDMFWPRVGDVWPIQYYDSLKLGDDQQEIFENSLWWLTSLDNIVELNPKLGDYLNSSIPLNSEWLEKRRFIIRHGKKDLEECYRLLDEEFSCYDKLKFFSCPRNKVEADFIMQKLAEQNSYSFSIAIDILETLLLHLGTNQGVGSYILNKLLNNQWFWQLDPKYILPMFTVACEGVRSEDELKPLRRLAQKTIEYYDKTEQSFFNLNDIGEDVSSALKMAEQRVPQIAKTRRNFKNLRKHTEEVAKTMKPYDPTDVCIFKNAD